MVPSINLLFFPHTISPSFLLVPAIYNAPLSPPPPLLVSLPFCPSLSAGLLAGMGVCRAACVHLNENCTLWSPPSLPYFWSLSSLNYLHLSPEEGTAVRLCQFRGMAQHGFIFAKSQLKQVMTSVKFYNQYRQNRSQIMHLKFAFISVANFTCFWCPIAHLIRSF